MAGNDHALSDEELAILLHKHLGLNLRTTESSAAKRAVKRTAPKAQQAQLSLDAFVQQCGEQLELEEAEEVAQAELELNSYSAAGAQVRACRCSRTHLQHTP